MKQSACPSRAVSKAFRAIALTFATGAVLTPLGAHASTRPHYGGALRVQMSERVITIDPRQWPSGPAQAAAAERVDSLVFDRLVRLDEHGSLQPALAVSWQHDPDSNRWEFRLRDGAKFSDGAPLTPAAAASALQQLLGNAFDVSATSNSVAIQAEHPLPNLAMQLALGRYFIFHIAEGGAIAGTGPFRVAGWPGADSAAKAIFVANEACWAGRPFVDKIELTMGVEVEAQANAIAFGQIDVVDLPASQVRRAAQRGVRTVSSDPVELLALQVDAAKPSVQDVRVRQAISLAIDRASIADVILQRQAVVAGSLLPNWLSGYGFLFRVTADLPRAKELLSATGREVSRQAPLVLVYDSGDVDAQAVAERVLVNLREAGMVAQISARSAGPKNIPADLRLVRYRVAGPDVQTALAEMLNAIGEPQASLETAEQAYAAERSPIDAFRVIPLAHVSESFGLGLQVRDWMAPRWGGWRLADVWLGPASTSKGLPQ
jgi:ABC-type transport system substrate-binding protein